MGPADLEGQRRGVVCACDLDDLAAVRRLVEAIDPVAGAPARYAMIGRAIDAAPDPVTAAPASRRGSERGLMDEGGVVLADGKGPT